MGATATTQVRPGTGKTSKPQIWWSNSIFFVAIHVAAVAGAYYKPPTARFTDDPIHDPYAATRGLFYSHMGWIFYKPTYDRMGLIDRDDLDRDADWDPSKWIIALFHAFGLASGLRRARETDLLEAKVYMKHKNSPHHHQPHTQSMASEPWNGELWGAETLRTYINSKPGRCILLLDGFLVDATGYLSEHVRIHSLTEGWRIPDTSTSREALLCFDAMRCRRTGKARMRPGRLQVASTTIPEQLGEE
ncbi:hypothetical protein HWV62_20126 [Athelia sp. TMB]|nr:hypothetical protein HWV62_20126 [Athelia sp. TMB]